jgi:hypothetical protein
VTAGFGRSEKWVSIDQGRAENSYINSGMSKDRDWRKS